MKKRLFVVVSIGLATVLILVFLYTKVSNDDIYSDYKKINRKEVLSQKESRYLVYYYMEDCYDCRLVEKEFMEKSSKIDDEIYLVDLNDWDNSGNSYDWKEHHKNYDIEIGQLNDDDKEEFYENESEDKYLNGNLKNEYDSLIDYEIVICDKTYQFENVNAELDKIYAKNNTPNIKKDAKTEDEIEIPGAPMLLEIEDKKISEIYFDTKVIEYFKEID
jgi:hypothetical protein